VMTSMHLLFDVVLLRLELLRGSFSSTCLFLLSDGLSSVETESLVDCRLWWIGGASSIVEIAAGLVVVCCSGNGDATSGNAIVHSSAISSGDNVGTFGSGEVH